MEEVASHESSFERALTNLAARYGNDPTRWRWGQAHIASLRSPIFARIPGLAQLTDLSTPSPGGFYTVNRGASRLADAETPFSNGHGAGYRAVYDLGALSEPTGVQVMIATGQSGHPASPHWGDFVARWVAGELRPLAQSVMATTQLQPTP